MSRKPAVFAVYLAALFQGLALVIFPAVSEVFKRRFGFSDAQYGTIFLPQMALAISGALVGGRLSRRLGLKRILLFSVAANTISQASLFAASLVAPTVAMLPVMLGTSLLGLGFGLSAAPQNGFPGLLFPEHRDVALVASHATVGLGLALGPLPAGWLGSGPAWRAYPIGLMLLGVLVVILTAASALPASRESVPDSGSAARTDARSLWQTPRFLVIAIIALLYGWQEGIFQNWGIILLREEKGIPPATAALALTTFWMTATAGRILVSLLLLRFRPGTIWRILPFVIGASFLAIPRSAGPLTGVVLFALAGLGCSAFFPLTVAIGTRAFADRESLAASGLIVMLVAGNSGGTFVYGALRGWLSLGTLYQCSALLTGIMLLFIGLAAASSTSPPAPSRRH